MVVLIFLFMVGDVMLGCGIDMILEYFCNFVFYESNGFDVRDYVFLVEIEIGFFFDKSERFIDYIWGDVI